MSEKNDFLALLTRETSRLEKSCAGLRRKLNGLQLSLETSRQALEDIVIHLIDGLILVEPAGLVTLFNPAAAEITGKNQNQVLGHPFWANFSDTLFGFSMEAFLKKASASVQHIFLTLQQQREIEVVVSTIENRGLLLLLKDNTHVRQMEESLKQAEKLKELGEMAAALAHEIRNPLGAIEGFTSLLKRGLKKRREQKLLDSILEGTRALNRFVTSVLEYSKPFTLHFTANNLVTLIHEVMQFIAQDPLACPCRFESQVEAYLISCDQDAIRTVLLNLLKNAFESETQEVLIQLKKDGTVIVSDRGKGIAPHLLSQIFTPFFTTKEKGTGLGLARSYKIIQAHGGRLTCESELGKGTTFTLKLVYAN
jgi:PAS domain S-box-containing protein